MNDYQQQQKRHFLRNYLLLATEGGLFMGGMAFVLPTTVAPLLVSELGGPEWVVSYMPTIMMIGFTLPQLFVAHLIEGMKVTLPWVAFSGFFQRIPFLVAALTLFFLAQSHPLLTLYIVALAPLLSGFLGGLNGSAWIELNAKCVPPHRRASLSALRSTVKDSIGLLAGVAVFAILARIEGPPGFGVLHLITFGAMLFSLGALIMVKEPVDHDLPPRRNARLLENLRSIPQLLRDDRGLSLLILTRMCSIGMFLLIPFLSIHAVRTLGRGNEIVGVFVTLQTLGGLSGNLLSAWVGDRHGSRILVVASLFVYLALCVLAVIAATQWGFYALFFLLGLAQTLEMIGIGTLKIEMFSPTRRPTSVSLLSFAILVSLISVGALAGTVRGLHDTILASALAAAACVIASIFFVLRIQDPRKTGGSF